MKKVLVLFIAGDSQQKRIERVVGRWSTEELCEPRSKSMMSDGRVVRARVCDSAIFDSIDPNCVTA